MNTTNLPTRIIAAGLPLLVIALVFGAMGYTLTKTRTRAVPPLPPAVQQATGVEGVVSSLQGNQLTLTTTGGRPQTFTLQPGATIETLKPATLADVKPGDWVNGGAIQHPQTTLALTGLIVIPNPVVPPQ
ncbi:MAG TPA: hypothetical protein VFY10_06575 [Dehalococcoidia bacterium]|nr:hypothetical protein [Dehalococcoidia bacterium]